jgi:hypothetical protein
VYPDALFKDLIPKAMSRITYLSRGSVSVAHSVLGFTVVLFGLLVLTSPSSSHAQLCLPGVGCVGGKGGFDVTLGSFNIYLKNKSRTPISACVRYYSSRNYATIDGTGTNWNHGCWDIAPGKTVFAVNDAKGRIAYFSAIALDASGMVWQEREVDMGRYYTRFEHSFR